MFLVQGWRWGQPLAAVKGKKNLTFRHKSWPQKIFLLNEIEKINI